MYRGPAEFSNLGSSCPCMPGMPGCTASHITLPDTSRLHGRLHGRHRRWSQLANTRFCCPCDSYSALFQRDCSLLESVGRYAYAWT